jgi:hypothetical protein
MVFVGVERRSHGRSGQWFVPGEKLFVSPFASDIHLHLGNGPLD